ncbi:UbiH/UbiF family hydroxylase [Betaproteobacteria bacterium SCN1]|jgi:2-octaprenyl-6-methoxyphenol hydroxylase|nr:UbiH/UbiF family hydroxylase [Betaproteobacteria bacterium SCN1]
MNAERYQAVVVGAGLVGAATALALSRQGLRVALVERAEPVAPTAEWDARIYALTPANQRLLASLGAWARMDASRVQPVYRMDVAGDGNGHVRLDAYASGTAQLAFIFESGRLQQALWEALIEGGEVAVHCPAAISTLERDGVDTHIRLDDGRTLAAQLVIGADGAHSRIRDWAGLTATVSPYGQSGTVTNFECEKPHRGTAFQWFFDSDILAFLPLPGNRMSMVWSTQTAHANELVALPADALAEQVRQAGHDALGALRVVTPAAAFPLRLIRVEAPVAPGVALVGDAAHGVHPLAGQGVNLGFGDVEVLAGVLAAHRRAHLGDLRVLQAYARARAEPVARMQAVTHGLHHLFADVRAGWLRNAGMSVVDRLPPLKAALVREAMS